MVEKTLTQAYLIQQLLINPDFIKLCIDGDNPPLIADYFTHNNKTIFRMIKGYYDRWKRPITQDDLISILAKGRTSENIKSMYDEVESWKIQPESNYEWLLYAANRFVRAAGVDLRLTEYYDEERVLTQAEQKAIFLRAAEALDVTIGEETPKTNPFVGRMKLREYADKDDEPIKWTIDSFVSPHLLCIISGPKGCGKTNFVYALSKALTQTGIWMGKRIPFQRVLLCNRDMPKTQLIQRLKLWGLDFETNEYLHIMGRDTCPALTDIKSWKLLPTDEHDLIIIDSLGASTETLGTKNDNQYKQIIGVLRDLSEKGPQIILINNTTRDGARSKGIAEIFDRMDMEYEVRDCTGLVPSGKEDQMWFEQLPDASADTWANLKARRQGKEAFRLAFCELKGRVGDIPTMAFEINTSKVPWEIADVTQQLEHPGQAVATFDGVTEPSSEINEAWKKAEAEIRACKGVGEKAELYLQHKFANGGKFFKDDLGREATKYGIASHNLGNSDFKKTHILSVPHGSTRAMWSLKDIEPNSPGTPVVQ